MDISLHASKSLYQRYGATVYKLLAQPYPESDLSIVVSFSQGEMFNIELSDSSTLKYNYPLPLLSKSHDRFTDRFISEQEFYENIFYYFYDILYKPEFGEVITMTFSMLNSYGNYQFELSFEDCNNNIVMVTRSVLLWHHVTIGV